MYFQCPGWYIVGTLSMSLQCICSVPAQYTTPCPQCHAVGNANDPAVRRIRWLNDSFPDLLFPDRVWGEAIKASRLWEEWGPTGRVRDPVFTRLLANGVWDSNEGRRSTAEIESMRYTAALASRLMLRGLEQETKVRYVHS